MLPLIILILLCTSSTFATPQDVIEKWAEYRITEMFSLPASQDDATFSEYFTEEAWSHYQQSLKDSMIVDYVQNNQYSILLDKFVKPVKVSAAPDGSYYAQSTFLLKFSNKSGSWLQPMEMILTVKESNSHLYISEFEGIAATAIEVRNYKADSAQKCHSRKI